MCVWEERRKNWNVYNTTKGMDKQMEWEFDISGGNAVYSKFYSTQVDP